MPMWRRTALTLALVLPLAGACAPSDQAPPAPSPTSRLLTAQETATATQQPTEPPTPNDPPAPAEIDTSAARQVALALATGDEETDIGQHLSDQAAAKALQIIERGSQANASTLSRFGTVRHAMTLDRWETTEITATGRAVVTVITLGWDAAPEDQEAPPRLVQGSVPGSPGTLAWYFEVDQEGLITGIWEESEVGDFD